MTSYQPITAHLPPLLLLGQLHRRRQRLRDGGQDLLVSLRHAAADVDIDAVDVDVDATDARSSHGECGVRRGGGCCLYTQSGPVSNTGLLA